MTKRNLTVASLEWTFSANLFCAATNERPAGLQLPNETSPAPSGRSLQLPDATVGIAKLRLPIVDAANSCCLIKFDQSRFVQSDFQLAGVYCPIEVGRSVRKRQAEFLFGRMSARQCLNRLGVDDQHVGIGRLRQPVWPSGIIGSISHNESLAVAVALRAGTYTGVGIDIEHVVDAAGAEALRSVVNCEELALLRKHSSVLSLPVLLTAVFSAKESFFKAVFNNVKRYLDFDCATLTEFQFESRVLTLTLNETLCDELSRGSKHHVHFELLRPEIILTYYFW